MFFFGKFSKRIIFSEVFLFIFVLTVMIVRFWGLFQDGNLPGWDTPAHFFTLSKMAEQYLPHGEITGYMREWFGGFPLFQFYAPLFFILVSALWLLTFGALSLTFIFRIVIFLSLFAVVFAFWYFLKTFFDREVAKIGIISSLLFIFYPKAYAASGIGAGAAIFGGLVSSVAGLALVFFLLAFLEKLRQQPDSLRYFLGSIFLLTSLALMHTLSFIGGFVAALIFIALYWREKDFFKKSLLVLGFGFLLSLFWLIPFLQYLGTTSSEGVTINIFKDPLIALFPFNLKMLFYFQMLPYFKFWALALFILTAGGVYLLLRKGKIFFPLLFGIFFIFIVRDYLLTMFPDISLHYYRLVAFLFLIALALGTYAMRHLLSFLENNRLRALVYVLSLLILSQAIFQFDVGTNEFSPYLEKLYNYKDSLIWKDEELEYTNEANFLISKIGNLEDALRIFPEMPYDDSLFYLGSPHYFTAKIPLIANKDVITGLYAESAPLTPFIMPVVDALTEGRNIIWAENKLKPLKLFYEQDFENHLERLGNFGVNYVVSYTSRFIEKLIDNPNAEFLGRTEHFFLFRLKKAKPFIYHPAYEPALYLNNDGKISFRDVALTLFSGTSTMNFPLVDGGKAWSNVGEEILDRFSFFIVSGSNLSGNDLERLLTLRRPLIILNAPTVLKGPYTSLPFVHFIDDFETVKKGKSRFYYDWPRGWQSLFELVEKYASPYRSSLSEQVILGGWSDKEIRFNAVGPVIVNAGFSSYWQRVNCGDCVVYQVSPAQMLVFSDGETTLRYEGDTVKKFATLVSLLTAGGLLLYVLIRFFHSRKIRRKNRLEKNR